MAAARHSDSHGISVVVPCLNRAPALDGLLRSLTWSAVPPAEYEVLICDDGSTDGVECLVDGWRQSGVDARLLRVRSPGAAPRNNAAARNAGLRASRFPILLNTDTDIVFVSDVLAQMRASIRDGAFCSPAACHPLTRHSTAELQGHPADRRADDYLEHAVGRPNQVQAPDGVGALHAAFACWRTTLTEIGGYDESYDLWGWEDADLLTRLQRGLGLQRIFVPGTVTVHQWHPAQRGDDRRAHFAAAGEISLLALKRQLQRSMAPLLTSVVRNRAASPPTLPAWVDGSLNAGVYREIWRLANEPAGGVVAKGGGRADLSPCPLFQAVMTAHRYEADALLQAGYPDLARRLLLSALSRPWERPGDRWDWRSPLPSLGAVATPNAAHYRDSGSVLLELARCAEATGRRHEAEAILGVLEGWPVDSDRAWQMRALRSMRSGHWTAAQAAVDRALKTSRRPEYLALLVEILLRTNHPRAAARIVANAVGTLANLDLFQRLLLDGYVGRLLPLLDAGSAGSSRLRTFHLAEDAERSEFLFSVAVRAVRSGLDLAAATLFERFVEADPPAEPRLRRESLEFLEVIRNRLSRRESRRFAHTVATA